MKPCKYGHKPGRNKHGQCLECNRIKAKARWDSTIGAEFKAKRDNHDHRINFLIEISKESRRALLRRLVAEEYDRINSAEKNETP